jgi:hypothetical protein
MARKADERSGGKSKTVGRREQCRRREGQSHQEEHECQVRGRLRTLGR